MPCQNKTIIIRYYLVYYTWDGFQKTATFYFSINSVDVQLILITFYLQVSCNILVVTLLQSAFNFVCIVFIVGNWFLILCGLKFSTVHLNVFKVFFLVELCKI